MNFRTIINVDSSSSKISYNDRVMFIGSCFASSIGSLMQAGKMPVMINPAGTVYNPVSISNTIDNIISGKTPGRDDLYCHEGTWLSFFHYTEFSSDDPDKLLEKINKVATGAREFLSKSAFLFITFGTARIYRWKKTGLVVSNCHRIPANNFDSELLTVEEIVSFWTIMLDRLFSLYPNLKVIFTVSPVRHWKDGAHGNQVSKSVLFLAVEELLKHPSIPHYFPAYELLMDDLRDYRFYDDDMLHPSTAAIDYIWDKFSGAYLDSETVNLRNEIFAITKAMNHRFISDSNSKKKAFAEKMLMHISDIELRNTGTDLTVERDYFNCLLDK